jgi:hypothetical protein
MTSKARWLSIRETVFKEQRGRCTRCGKSFASHEGMHAHHAIYTRAKGLEKWLDSEENIELVCHKCHADHGYLSSWFGRCMAYTRKVELGYDMEKWNAEIPMLIKDEFIVLGKEK